MTVPTTSVVALPGVYSRSNEQFAHNESVTKTFGANPILQLCCKLATHRIVNRQTVELRGRNVHPYTRLYTQIGYAISSGAFKRLKHLSAYQWKTIENCWIANMHTVLLHPEFNPLVYDIALIGAIRRYKRWFVEFMTMGRVKTLHDGNRHRKIVQLWNLDKGLKALKTLAGYFQYYLCSDYEHNARPPELKFWKGWCQHTKTMRFVWFSGHLRQYNNLERRLSDKELVALAQIRTFGRALPPPTRNMCRSDLKGQIDIITRNYEIGPIWLNAVETIADRFAMKNGVGECPLQTHISVSTSGCYERSTSQGGHAGYVRDAWVKPLREAKLDLVTLIVSQQFDGIVSETDILGLGRIPPRPRRTGSPFWKFLISMGREFFPNPSIELFDVWGNVLTHDQVNVVQDHYGLLSILYRQQRFQKRSEMASLLLQTEEPLPNELGFAMLLCASAESALQGTFDPVPSCWMLVVGLPPIPLWRSRETVTYTPREVPRVKLTCLAEPGAKTRPLGVGQSWFVAIERAMRFMFEPIIARDGRARIGLRATNKMWSFLKFLGNFSGLFSREARPWLQSSDFKAATDYIPLSFIEAMWKGFMKGLPHTHPFRVYSKVIWSQRRCSLLDFKELNSYFSEKSENMHSTCASFMGEPISFLTLTGTNLVIEDLSSYIYYKTSALRLKSPRSLSDLRQAENLLISMDTDADLLIVKELLAICGDDVAAIRNALLRIMCFKHVAILLGMVFSWKDAISQRIMIFCEDHVLFQNETGKPVYVDVIKSRLLTPMTRQHSDNRSSILGKGRMLRNQLDYFENDALKSSIMTVYRNIFDNLYGRYNIQALTVPLWLPPACGGIGFPLLEKEIPDWGWKYIKYVYNILDEPDVLKRFIALSTLKVLNLPSKKGIETWSKSLEMLSSALTGYDHYEYNGNLEEVDFSGKKIFPDRLMIDLVKELRGHDVPPSPYDPLKVDYDSLENEINPFGFIKVTDFVSN